jgi:TPP-dependent pyruvate/acetoin dehydrogenase alpha subunit
MTAINHKNILEAGRYAGVQVAPDEGPVAQALYRFMLRLRRCEEALAQEYHPADEMRCPVHFCVGQEAVPAALSALLREEDYLYSHHRSHGYFLAKGAPMPALFAELYGKETGANAGLAGSQDISYPSRNFHSGAILAGATAIALGTALALQQRGTGAVAVAGFGESATDEGIFWEAVNYAALAKLPAVFVCENNNYSVFSPQLKRTALDNISERVTAFGMKAVSIFGNDAMLVYRTMKEAVARARDGGGPTFVEAYTYRWSGHYGPASDDLVGYRSVEELEAWKRNCPVQLLGEAMRRQRLIDEKGAAALEQDYRREIAECFAFAKGSAFPSAPASWNALNAATSTPLADRLLVDLDLAEFDARQEVVQAKGY